MPSRKYSCLLEAIVAQGDGVLDDPVGTPFILLRGNVEVSAQPDAHLLASFNLTGSKPACPINHLERRTNANTTTDNTDKWPNTESTLFLIRVIRIIRAIPWFFFSGPSLERSEEISWPQRNTESTERNSAGPSYFLCDLCELGGSFFPNALSVPPDQTWAVLPTIRCTF